MPSAIRKPKDKNLRLLVVNFRWLVRCSMTLLKVDYRPVARSSRFLVTWRCLHLVKGRLIGEVWQKSRDFNLGKLYILLGPLRIFGYVTRQSYLLFCKTNMGEKR